MSVWVWTKISNKLNLSSAQEIIKSLSNGHKISSYQFGIGYSGWGPGQLESELRHGDWMVLPADQRLIFDTPDNIMWKTAYIKLGINISDFGGQSGISWKLMHLFKIDALISINIYLYLSYNLSNSLAEFSRSLDIEAAIAII